MRFSWVEPEAIRVARETIAIEPDTEEDFTDTFELPPPPEGVSAERWPAVAEHVARADRVARLVQQDGLEGALAAFGDSPHAVEVAAVAAAAFDADRLDIDLIESLLACKVDELVAYGAVLTLLVEIGAREDEERMVRVYESFCATASRRRSPTPIWRERVAAMQGGLAGAYVACGRCDDAHRLFAEEHRKASSDLLVALSASRTFLAAGDLAHAAEWLGLGADRARDIGRPHMEQKLREKSVALRTRMG